MISENTSALLEWLIKQFHLYGWPQFVRTDGGPQFRSDFAAFCRINGICHELSSPYNPRSNGLAESGVQSIKHILRRCAETGADIRSALSIYNSAPRADGYSPFQLFFGRTARLPGLPSLPRAVDVRDGMARRDEQQIRQSQHFALHARDYSPLALGSKVVFQDGQGRWTRPATIVARRPGGLSYDVRDDASQRVFLRGRRLLRPFTRAHAPRANAPCPLRPPSTVSSQSTPPPTIRRSPRFQSR